MLRRASGNFEQWERLCCYERGDEILEKKG